MRYQIAALYVEDGGVYFGVDGVDPWPESRDARNYAGPYPVIAHPPCQRWGRFWHGSPRKPHQYKLGDDNGCFAAALAAVRTYGGVLEHPADSKAWDFFGLNKPSRKGGWIDADSLGGKTCYVAQGNYGHNARKGTWLYTFRTETPDLDWRPVPQRLHQGVLETRGYEVARRMGMVSVIGGKRKTDIRNATPVDFRDLLILLARTVK